MLLLSRIGISVVAATTSAEAALDAIALHYPELFVIEPLLTEVDALDGLECIRRSRLADPDLAVVALSAGAAEEWRQAVLAAGATAFVPKSASIATIGETVIDALERSRCGDEPLLSALTPRERDVLALVSAHRTNAAVAQILWLSPDTVKFHLANVYSKLGVSSRSEAARWARRHGLAERPKERPLPPLWPVRPFAGRRDRGRIAPSRSDSVRSSAGPRGHSRRSHRR